MWNIWDKHLQHLFKTTDYRLMCTEFEVWDKLLRSYWNESKTGKPVDFKLSSNMHT